MSIVNAASQVNDSGEKQNDDWEKEGNIASYQVATSFMAGENQLNWSRFNVMVAANSVIIATTAAILKAGSVDGTEPWSLFSRLLPFAGLSLCFLWLLMMERGLRFHRNWRDKVIDLENKLELPIKVVSDVVDAEKKLNRWNPTRIGVGKCGLLVIIIFVVLYAYALFVPFR